MNDGTRWVPSRRVALGLTGALVAALLAGCTSVRSTLGTASANCYVALPNAGSAVHEHGHLEGTRLENVAAMATTAPVLSRAVRDLPGPPVRRVCLVAFGGRFLAAQVDHPIGARTGPVAVVELTYPGSKVVATLLAKHPPLRVGHSHVVVP